MRTEGPLHSGLGGRTSPRDLVLADVWRPSCSQELLGLASLESGEAQPQPVGQAEKLIPQLESFNFRLPALVYGRKEA